MIYTKYPIFLVCAVTFFSIYSAEQKRSNVKKHKKPVITRRIECTQDMKVATFKESVAQSMNADPRQITIVFNQADITYSENTLQELGINSISQLQVIIQPGFRKQR